VQYIFLKNSVGKDQPPFPPHFLPAAVGQNPASLLGLDRSKNWIERGLTDQPGLSVSDTADDLNQTNNSPNQIMKIKKKSRPTSPSTDKPTAVPAVPPRAPVTREAIAVRAHALWEQAGHPNGRDLEFWVQAEQQLKK